MKFLARFGKCKVNSEIAHNSVRTELQLHSEVTESNSSNLKSKCFTETVKVNLIYNGASPNRNPKESGGADCDEDWWSTNDPVDRPFGGGANRDRGFGLRSRLQ